MTTIETKMPFIPIFKGAFSLKMLNLTFERKWETNDTNCSCGGKHSCNRPHAHKLSLIKLILQFWTGLFFTFDIFNIHKDILVQF